MLKVLLFLALISEATASRFHRRPLSYNNGQDTPSESQNVNYGKNFVKPRSRNYINAAGDPCFCSSRGICYCEQYKKRLVDTQDTNSDDDFELEVRISENDRNNGQTPQERLIDNGCLCSLRYPCKCPSKKMINNIKNKVRRRRSFVPRSIDF